MARPPEALEEALRRYLAGDAAELVPGEVAAELSGMHGAVLHDAVEHELGRLLVLAGVCVALSGGRPPTAGLLGVADRYAQQSPRCTGRILERMKAALELTERAACARSVPPLVEAADQVSQGWPTYAASAFPAAFARLAAAWDPAADPDEFRLTSYTAWDLGVRRAAEGAADDALVLYERSLDRSIRLGYHAEVAWLYTDVVLARLLQGDLLAAEAALDDQRRYVSEAIAGHTGGQAGAGDHTIDIGEIASGAYQSFLDTRPRGDHRLSSRDVAILLRYLTASRQMISFSRSARPAEFEAAVDAFTFGWTRYSASPYPAIFSRLAEAKSLPPPRINPFLTVYARWSSMLSAVRLPVAAHHLASVASEVRERLQRIGFRDESAIALLDAVMLCVIIRDRQGASRLLAQELAELRERVPDLVQAAISALEADDATELEPQLTTYLARRARYTVPEFIPALSVFRRDRPARPELEIQLVGDSLFIDSVLVQDPCPRPLRDVLVALNEQLVAATAAGTGPPFVSGQELGACTGRTPAGIAQAVRRFRAVCAERLHQASGRRFDKEAVIQGRPGYRLNPEFVTTVRIEPTPPDPPARAGGNVGSDSERSTSGECEERVL